MPDTKGRGALLGSIEGFSKGKLKKASTNDRSAPVTSCVTHDTTNDTRHAHTHDTHTHTTRHAPRHDTTRHTQGGY
jgi:hypothetical protein